MSNEDKIELRSEEFQEVLGYVPPWILRWGVTGIAIIIVILLIGSSIIKYPDVIPAQIVLTGSVPPAAIAAHASGKLNKLFVVDNQKVKTRDYLAIIDNPACTEDILELKRFLDCFIVPPRYDSDTTILLPSKELQVGDLQTTYSSFYNALFNYLEFNRLLYYSQKIRMTEERIGQYEEQYRTLQRQHTLTKYQSVLVQNQYRRDSTLYSTGVISKEELEKSENTYLQSKISGESMCSTLNGMQIQIAQLKEQLLDVKHQDIEILNGFQTQLQSLVTQLKTEIQSWELNYVLMAPIDGIITFTNYWIENQNITTGAEVFTILPQGNYRIIGKAMLPITRSGKVEPGQKVNIRLSNFPENEFGILRGTVENISLVPTGNRESAHYMLEIALPDGLLTTYKKELPYLPNMQGQAEIITEEISLLERFILPLKRILSESI